MERPSKVLVVGGGIAGYSVLFYLMKAGIQAILYDLSENNTSSRKAAGLVNPFIIKRYALTWKGAEAYKKACHFYHDLQTRAGIRCLDLSPLYRWLPHENVRNEWIRMRQEKTTLTEYMGLPEPVPTNTLLGGWQAAIPQSFRIRTESLFRALEKIFRLQTRNACFAYENLKPFKKNQWIYEDEAWDAVIFCEGTSVINNPFFRESFIRHCKGQWLVTHNPGLEAAYLGALFLLPEPQKRLLVGSTYEHHFAHHEPDELGRQKLSDGYKRMTGLEPLVLKHVSGIRPVSADRRPVTGPHPHYPGLFILNGLGSRGFLLAPYLAEKLVKYLLKEEGFPPEVQYNRFLKNA